MAVHKHGTTICQKGSDGGIFLPAFGDDEHDWPKEVRACAYGVALLYFFLGISVVSDTFMEAIENITSQKKRVKSRIHEGKWVTVLKWNTTVANLTLMALGSSAPEILLSIVELIGDDMHSGDLGPSTVLGSAAFNLFVIVAVCVSAIPSGDVRYVQARMVFALTAVYSLFAYFWLLIIVEYVSPGIITPWEGLVTLAMLPVFVLNSFVVDKIEYKWLRQRERKKRELELAENESEAVASDILGIGSQKSTKSEQKTISGSSLFDEDTIRPSPSRRIGSGIRLLMGGMQKSAGASSSFKSSNSNLTLEKETKPTRLGPRSEPDVVLEFESDVVLAGRNAEDSVVSLTITRRGNLHGWTDVKYETEDGVCKEGVDYVAQMGNIVFAPGDTKKDIDVQFLSGDKMSGWLRVNLREPENGIVGNKVMNVQLGKCRFAYIVISRDPTVRTSPEGVGLLTFGGDSLEVSMGTQERRILVPVFRLHSFTTAASCCFRTESLSAVPGYDYVEDEGKITFQKDQALAILEFIILPKKLGELKDEFQIVLERCTGAVQFDAFDDGGEEANILTVTILNSRSERWAGIPFFRLLDCLFNIDFLMSVLDQWRDQIVSACFVGGDAEAQHEATIGAWSIHFAVIPWKLLYGIFCPPPAWAWPCFVLSLAHIGLLTAFVYDLAELLGCVVNMDDRVTAITIVALGTSLPDLFASRSAAMNDPTADASIVNVTGSNAVNVFLGIGLTWSMGAVYWNLKGTTAVWKARYGHLGHPEGSFVVAKGNLAFSVIVFLIAACICLLILAGRRKAFGGELGGPRGAKYLTSISLVGLWLGYIILSVWNSNGDRSGSEQSLAVLSACAATAGLMLAAGIVLNLVRALTVNMNSGEEIPMEERPSIYEEEKRKVLALLKRLFPKLRWIDHECSKSDQDLIPDEEEATEVESLVDKGGRDVSSIHGFGPVLEELQAMRSELQQWTKKLAHLERIMPHIQDDEIVEGGASDKGLSDSAGSRRALSPSRSSSMLGPALEDKP